MSQLCQRMGTHVRRVQQIVTSTTAAFPGAVYLLKAAQSGTVAGQYLHTNPTIYMLNTLPILVKTIDYCHYQSCSLASLVVCYFDNL